MSLKTDIIFVKALQSNSELISMLPAGGIYNTSIALPDVNLDNAPIPYVIVSFDGVQNQVESKDANYEGVIDNVQISIEIAAETRAQLAEIAQMVRDTVRDYFENLPDDDDDFDLVPLDYTFSAQGVIYYPDKPDYWQVLSYSCETNID